MTAFLWNILLALAWAAMTENYRPAGLIAGFALGFFILYFARRIVGRPDYLIKTRQSIGLFLFTVWELILANLRVAYDVLTPRYFMRPGVVAVPLDARTDAEITLLANLITLTPGTLSLDVSSDRRVLYVHVMYIDDDIDAVRRKIKDGFEKRVLEVLGP
ncbi:MAG TPA: Na+/H+ antiporter subunit E [candidate division Zixibacteria bacterium]|nr:Na+/H+ antiporter subunit E [candidate division Zixibacteria bacterium]